MPTLKELIYGTAISKEDAQRFVNIAAQFCVKVETAECTSGVRLYVAYPYTDEANREFNMVAGMFREFIGR